MDLFDEQPLIGGALAFTLGAALTAALPRTRIEDQYLGEHSDAAIGEAERIFNEEKAKLKEVTNAAGTEAEKAAKDLKNRAYASTVKDAVAEAGERVTKAAKDKAETKDVGEISS